MSEQHAWKPLGLARTLRFVFSRKPGYASWRHFGFEISLERTTGSWTLAVYVALAEADA